MRKYSLIPREGPGDEASAEAAGAKYLHKHHVPPTVKVVQAPKVPPVCTTIARTRH